MSSIMSMYTSLELNGDKFLLRNYHSSIPRMKKSIVRDMFQSVEHVFFGHSNPFPLCDVSKIKVLEINRDMPGSNPFYEHESSEYMRILKSIHSEYGTDAFSSLKRISGGCFHIYKFLAIFSNREFEFMKINSDGPPKVKNLSVDNLLLSRKPIQPINTAFRRVSWGFHMNMSEKIMRGDSGCETEVEIKDGVADLGILNLSAYQVVDSLKFKYYFPVRANFRVGASLVITFNRSSNQKSATKIVSI